MKKTFTPSTLAVLTMTLFSVSSFAQTASFSDQSSLLVTPAFHSGNGVAVCDMNGDFKDDIVRAAGNAVQYIEYQGTSNGAFTEASFPSQNIGDPWGMCVGDIDNNGYNDVLWGDYGSTYVLTANGTGTNYTSTNVTTLVGQSFIFVQGCNFADVNNDGKLDAFVCNDVAMPHIYVGNGTSNGWTFNQGLMPLATVPSSDNSGNYASIWTDVNNDNLIDLMITHCRQGVSNSNDARRIDQVFINNGNGTYTQDVTNWTGLRDGAQGWSTAWGDVDNDGDMDAFILNYDVNSKLMINNGSGVFTNAMSGSGISSTTSIFGENATFHDFDNDGYLDLLISGDHHLVYMNNGNNTFTQLLPDPFPYSSNTITAHAVGDLNNDGRLDVYASYCDIYQSPNNAKNDKVWMNTTSNANHYIKFNLVGGATAGMSNKNGIGAIVKIYGPWGVQVREVRSGEAYGIQNSFTMHFGLGANMAVDSVIVHWPSGIVDELLTLNADQTYTLNEGGFPTATQTNVVKNLDVQVLPNPMNGEGVIRISNYDNIGLGNLSLSIFDVTGKEVYSENNLSRNTIPVDAGMLSKGMYFYQVRNGNQRLSNGKFIIE